MKRFVQILGIRGLFVLLLSLLTFIFIMQNVEQVNVDFLFWTFVEVPKLYLMLICLFLGVLFGFFLGWAIFKKKLHKESY